MNRSALRLFAVVLLGGCAEPARDTEMAKDKSTMARATAAAETPAARPAAGESVPDATGAASPVDAERLLASALESAKADNKRAMVHLGAPW